MTQVIAPFSSSTLRAARAIDDPKQVGRPSGIYLNSKQKQLARHLTWDGKTIAEIRAALGLNCADSTLIRHLNKLNIRTNRSRRFERK